MLQLFNLFGDNMSVSELLSSNKLFKGLDSDVIRGLLEKISYQKNYYNKNDVIAMNGDRILGQYIMLSGDLISQKTNCQGKVVKIEDMKGSQLIAPAFLYGSDNHYPVDIIVIKAAKMIYISKDDFSSLLHMNAVVQQNFLNIISNKTKFLSNKIEFLALQSIKGKIASYILQQTRNNLKKTIALPYSQEGLAEFFGVTRPALARAFSELTKDHVLMVKGKIIRVLDSKALELFMR